MAEKTRFGWFGGRSGRAEYWALIGLVVALGVAISFVPGFGSAAAGGTVALLAIKIRRVHDFGRSGWWAGAATLAPMVFMVALAVATSLDAALLAATAMELGIDILIGAIPGTPGENRFGPRRPFTWQGLLSLS